MKTIKIGRSSTNDIVISDVTVSSHHAVITILDSREIRIKDMNSTNGTFVNDKRIREEVSIMANDVIKVGNYTVDWLKYLNELPKNVSPIYAGDISSASVKRSKNIGRIANNDIVFDQKDVSSLHAQLMEKTNGDIVLVDKGSTNGTYVNGHRISIQLLHKGDRVLIANKYPLQWENVFQSKAAAVSQPPKRNRKTTVAVTLTAGITALLLVALFIIQPWGQRPWSAEKIYTTYKKSVVMIEGIYYYQVHISGKPYCYVAVDKDGYLGFTMNLSEAKIFSYTGTGFFVSTDGKIVTNKHIVSPWEYDKETVNKIKELFQKQLADLSLSSREYFREIQPMISEVTVEGILYKEGFGIYLNDTHKSQGNKIPCSVVKKSNSEEIDLAVIQVNTKSLPPGIERVVNLQDAVTIDADIIVGNPVYTIGFPLGDFLANTSQGIQANNQDGKITQVRGDYEFGHNISIIGGASGSPVFDQYGKLIGIVHRGFGESQGYNMAVKARYAAELLK